MDKLLEKAKKMFAALQESEMMPGATLKNIVIDFTEKYPNKYLSQQLGINAKRISNWKSKHKQKNKQHNFIQVPVSKLKQESKTICTQTIAANCDKRINNLSIVLS